MVAFVGLEVVSPLSPFMWGWALVGVEPFLASEVVLSPVVSLHVALKSSCPVDSGCLRLFLFMSGWVLVGVVAFLGSEVVLSLFVLCCVRVVSGCLPLSPFMWGWVLVGVVAFLASEVAFRCHLSWFMWGWVLVGVVAFLGLFRCLPSCGSPVVSGCWLVW